MLGRETRMLLKHYLEQGASKSALAPRSALASVSASENPHSPLKPTSADARHRYAVRLADGSKSTGGDMQPSGVRPLA